MQHVCWAHKHGARVVTSAGAAAFDPAGQAKLSAMLVNATARAAWVAGNVAKIAASGADGITLDIEGNMEHATEMTLLVAELAVAARKANPLAQISFDSSVYPGAWNQSQSHCFPLSSCKMAGPSPGYDYAGLGRHIDFFVPMAYEFNYWNDMVRRVILSRFVALFRLANLESITRISGCCELSAAPAAGGHRAVRCTRRPSEPARHRSPM